MDSMLLLFVTATSLWASVVAGGPPRGEPPFVNGTGNKRTLTDMLTFVAKAGGFQT